MNNRKGNKKLNKPTDQRIALLRSLAVNLIEYNKIITTTPRAKQAKSFIEKLITLAKKNTVHSKRQIFSIVNNKSFVRSLSKVSEGITSRNSGYIKIVKCGYRKGDSAEMSQLELLR